MNDTPPVSLVSERELINKMREALENAYKDHCERAHFATRHVEGEEIRGSKVQETCAICHHWPILIEQSKQVLRPEMLDFNSPGLVEIDIAAAKDRVWVNVDGRCMLRCSQIKNLSLLNRAK